MVGWAFYGERLDLFVLLGALIIVSGVLWNLRSKSHERTDNEARSSMNFGLKCLHMMGQFCKFAGAFIAASLTFGAAHGQSSNSVCPRLEAQSL